MKYNSVNKPYLMAVDAVMESVGPDYRAFAGCAVQVATSLGFVMLPLIATSVRDDVMFQIASLTPIAIFFSMALYVKYQSMCSKISSLFFARLSI